MEDRLGGGGASEKGHPLGRDRIGQRFMEEGQLGGWHGLGKGRKESRGIISGKTVAILNSEEHRKMGDGYEKARQINECVHRRRPSQGLLSLLPSAQCSC